MSKREEVASYEIDGGTVVPTASSSGPWYAGQQYGACVFGSTWFRLAGSLVRGEAPAPIVRSASVADLVPSSASRLGTGWISIIPELSLQIEREPRGEWICVSSTLRSGDETGAQTLAPRERRKPGGRSSHSSLHIRTGVRRPGAVYSPAAVA
jgi:hypothetical protein